VGAVFILDACQSVPHLKVDFHAMDVDFAAWSAHKMYGPTGVGFLYGKRELLEALPPANFGGSMVELAWMDKPAEYMAPPARFEAGTQPVAQVVAAGVAADWMRAIGMENIEAHEKAIAGELLKLGDIDGVRILGPRENVDRIGTVAFDVQGVHPHDVGQFIDSLGIAIRVGHHCAQPVHRHFGLYASNRASTGVYNSVEDAQALVEAVSKVRPFFKV
jgi:cysteine desulfurase/selenocysteine lyase